MRVWKMASEPTLEELLDDEIMRPVMRSAGLDAAGLRALLRDLARRVALESLRPRCGCSSGQKLQPSVA